MDGHTLIAEAPRLVSIVDDDLSICRALGRVVKSAGYAVATFASAGEFLDSPALARVSCLVLDISLEGMSGFDLQERLAVDRPSLPVIFITGLDDATTNRCVRHSGLAHLHKPFDDYVLLDAIKHALDQGPMGGRGRAA